MIQTLWVVFSLAFVVALSGALAPGPLLTYTIVKTLETRRRPWLTGVWVIAGHALLETVLVLGGILVSMSNPYWWVWWATIGLALMAKYDIGFRTWPLIVVFLLGHEAGDLAWYWLVSGLVSLGGRRLTDGMYRGVLVGCAAVMVAFGLFLGLSPYVGGAA